MPPAPRYIGDILRQRNIELATSDRVVGGGFTQVPNFILKNGDLSLGANARRIKRRGCTMSVLAAGSVAEVFEWGARSAARKPTAFGEAAIHAAVEAMTLPVPAVWGVLEVGGRWGIVFDRVKERSFAERMREDPSVIPEYLEALARLHARIHDQPARQLGCLKSGLATRIAGTGRLDEPLKQILLDRLAGMPDGDRLCHGDFHPVNVLGQNSSRW
jgi:hypothetical protein